MCDAFEEASSSFPQLSTCDFQASIESYPPSSSLQTDAPKRSKLSASSVNSLDRHAETSSPSDSLGGRMDDISHPSRSSGVKSSIVSSPSLRKKIENKGVGSKLKISQEKDGKDKTGSRDSISQADDFMSMDTVNTPKSFPSNFEDDLDATARLVSYRKVCIIFFCKFIYLFFKKLC
jgi:hypothetical protein